MFCPLMIILSFSCSFPVFTLFYTSQPIPHFLHPPSLWSYRSREFLTVSCHLYQSGLRLRKPTVPRACSVLACSSTSRLWPTCSFSSKLPLFRQVGLPVTPDHPLISPLTLLNHEGCTKTWDIFFFYRDRVPTAIKLYEYQENFLHPDVNTISICILCSNILW